jgi:hypothetical protein
LLPLQSGVGRIETFSKFNNNITIFSKSLIHTKKHPRKSAKSVGYISSAKFSSNKSAKIGSIRVIGVPFSMSNQIYNRYVCAIFVGDNTNKIIDFHQYEE